MRGFHVVLCLLFSTLPTLPAAAQGLDPILKSAGSLGSVWSWSWRHGDDVKTCPGQGDGITVIFNNGKLAFRGRYKRDASDPNEDYKTFSNTGSWSYEGTGTGNDAGVRWYKLGWSNSTDTMRLTAPLTLKGSSSPSTCSVDGDRQDADLPDWAKPKD